MSAARRTADFCEVHASNALAGLSRRRGKWAFPLQCARGLGHLMKYQFEHVGFWGRLSDPKVAETARQVICHVHAGAARIVAPPSAERLVTGLAGSVIVEESELAAHANVIIAIGGDGT